MNFRILFAALMIAAVTQSCDLSPDCQSAIRNLSVNIIADVVSIFSGEEVKFECIVSNVTNTIAACSDNDTTTPSNKGKLTILYSANSTDFELVSEEQVEIPELRAGDEQIEKFTLTFDEKGVYRVIMSCNVDEEFREKILDDNESTTDFIVK